MEQRRLGDLEPRLLAEALVAVSRDVRRAVAAGDYVAIARALQDVRAAADAAGAERGLLLQVAEAFLRAMTNTSLGAAEAALRTFVTVHGASALSLLADALSATGIAPSISRQLSREAENALNELVEVGALRRLASGRLDVRPSLRGAVRDLVEPLAFRLWRRVESARAYAAYQRDPVRTAHFALAQQLGVSEQQAAGHLQAYPLSLEGQTTARDGAPQVIHAPRVLWAKSAPSKEVAPTLVAVQPESDEISVTHGQAN